MSEPTVYIVDPDEGLQSSLQKFLAAMSVSSAVFNNAETFLAQWDPSHAGCLITELVLGGMSGIELQRQLNSHDDALPIIFISEHADVATAVQAVQSGAVGFLTKPFSKQVLLENLRVALERDKTRRAHKAARIRAQAGIDSLTRRERQLMDCVVEGMKNREIAETLELNLKTVEMHRGKMMKKLQVETLVELIRLYQRVYPDVFAQNENITTTQAGSL